MSKSNETREPAVPRPQRLRRSTSSPSTKALRGEPEPNTFTKELQFRAARAKDLETSFLPDSERWMHVVMRREIMKPAVGRIVHVQYVGGKIQSTPQGPK